MCICCGHSNAREHGLNVSWICPTVSGRDWLKHSELASSDDTVLSWINDPGNLWSEFDFVIGPSSTSLFEAVMQGSLPISFSISDTQLSESIDWSRIGHVLHLAQSEINDAKALNTIMSLAFEYFQELRSELSKHSHLLDGNGAFRVAKAIANLPNKPNSPPNLTGSRSEEMVRECNLTDAVAFLQARNGISVRALSTNPDQINKWPDHLSWWLQKTVERFVLEDNNEIIAYFWHRSKKVAGHDYLIGGWFPASDRPSFTAAVRLLHWQLEYCANKYPGHLWIATINKRNRAVLSLNRRCGFTDADPFNIEVAKELFPGTSDDFQCLQRTSKL